MKQNILVYLTFGLVMYNICQTLKSSKLIIILYFYFTKCNFECLNVIKGH